MKNLIVLLGTVLSLAQIGHGATLCVPGTLASYVALGSGGCMIGVDTVGSFTKLSGQNGVSQIDPTTVTVTPSGTSTAPTLRFDVNVSSALAFESIFTYRISGASFTSSRITSSNSTLTGNGSATDIQNLCGGGTFGANGVAGCTGISLGPIVVSSPDTDSTSFVGVSFLSVTDDFTIDGGPASGRFVDSFTANVVSSVPEPGTIFITSLGTGLLLTLQLRSRRNRENQINT